MAKPAKKSNKLDYTALRKQLKAEGPGNLYMLWGPEDYLISDFVGRVKKACLSEGMEDFDYKRLDGPGIDVRDLAEALDAMPFFGGRTFVELRGFDINKCRDEETASLLADVPEWCTVVITLPAGVDPDGRLSLIKQIKNNGQAVEFTAQEQSALYEWLTKRFAAYGKTIGRSEMDRLMFLSGDLMNRLIPEIEKICSYAKAERVTLEDIEATAHHIPEADAFQMTDCISKGDYNGAAHYLSELMSGNREPIEVLGAIGWQVRRLYAARLSLDKNKGPNYTKEVLGIKNDYALRMLESTARNYTLEALRAYVRLCAEMDFRMKTSAGEETEILKELLVRFAMEGRCA